MYEYAVVEACSQIHSGLARPARNYRNWNNLHHVEKNVWGNSNYLLAWVKSNAAELEGGSKTLGSSEEATQRMHIPRNICDIHNLIHIYETTIYEVIDIDITITKLLWTGQWLLVKKQKPTAHRIESLFSKKICAMVTSN